MPISRSQIILLIAPSLMVGGISGAGFTNYYLKQKQRTNTASRYLLGSVSTLQEFDLLGQPNIPELKMRAERRLALCVIGAEDDARRNDRTGEIGREILRITAAHRTNASYLEEEAALRKMIAASRGLQGGATVAAR